MDPATWHEYGADHRRSKMKQHARNLWSIVTGALSKRDDVDFAMDQLARMSKVLKRLMNRANIKLLRLETRDFCSQELSCSGAA